MIKVTGIGAPVLDHVAIVEKLARFDREQRISSYYEKVGGLATIALATISRLGGKTNLFAYLGSDRGSRDVISRLEDLGVDVTLIRQVEEGMSSLALIFIEENTGRRAINYYPGKLPTFDTLTPQEQEDLKSANHLHLSCVPEIKRGSLQAAQLARSNGTSISYDGDNRLDPDFLPFLDILILSELVAEQIGGKGFRPRSVIEDLHSRGPQIVIVTKGERGSIGFDGKQWISQSAFNMEVVDTLGAGDVYQGAFIFAYLSDYPFPECIKFATVAAGLSCKGHGNETIPTLQEIQDRLRGLS